MPIEVVCPNGHLLKVKDKYAGKSGLCPHCQAPLLVPAPRADDEDDSIELVPRKRIEDELTKPLPPAAAGGHIDDDDEIPGGGTPSKAAASAAHSAGESLLGSAVIKHQKMCRRCHQMSPIWFARCPNCDCFFRT